MADDIEDFFEEDEPVEKIRAAFERGEKGYTTPPASAIRVVRSTVRFEGFTVQGNGTRFDAASAVEVSR
jgi:hypothetical protein